AAGADLAGDADGGGPAARRSLREVGLLPRGDQGTARPRAGAHPRGRRRARNAGGRRPARAAERARAEPHPDDGPAPASRVPRRGRPRTGRRPAAQSGEERHRRVSRRSGAPLAAASGAGQWWGRLPEVTTEAFLKFGPLIETRLRVVTWNLWGRGRPWEGRLARLRSSRVALARDVVALKEVWEDGSRNQAAVIAADLGFHHVFASRYAIDGVAIGNAVLSRWPIKRHEVRPLPAP